MKHPIIPRFEIDHFHVANPVNPNHPYFLGSARLFFPDFGVLLHEVQLRVNKKNEILIGLPKKKRVRNSDGAVIQDSIISFPKSADFHVFSAAVVAAVREKYPNVFEDLHDGAAND